MHWATLAVAEDVLKGRHFAVAVDLGCGTGLAGFFLKKHCDYLIGVDHSLSKLRKAAKRGCYNELIHGELQDYEISQHIEATFLFDVIEHLPEPDAYILLQKLNKVPFVLITTPETFRTFSWFSNGHQSLWPQQKLQQLGYQTTTYPQPLGYKKVLAIKQKR